LKSTVFPVILFVLNNIAFVHFLHSTQPTSDSSFFFTYSIYLSFEGIVAPAIIIYSVRSLKKFTFEHYWKWAENILIKIWARRRATVDPMIMLTDF
jgi:hypothetical protein